MNDTLELRHEIDATNECASLLKRHLTVLVEQYATCGDEIRKCEALWALERIEEISFSLARLGSDD